MLEISRLERDYLVQKGFKYGSDIHSTVHHRKYYATESYKVMKTLDKYRKEHTHKTN